MTIENSNGKKRKESGKKAEASAAKPKKGHEKLAKAVTTNSTEHTSRLLDLVANEALLADQDEEEEEEEEVKEQDLSEQIVTAAEADDETAGADAAKQAELDAPKEKKLKAKKKEQGGAKSKNKRKSFSKYRSSKNYSVLLLTRNGRKPYYY